MKKIIWISSYPKSGNTFVRSLLVSYFFSLDGIFEQSLLKKIPEFSKDFLKFEKKKYPENEMLKWNDIQKEYAQNFKKFCFLKTHVANIKIRNKIFSINSDHTLGCIYIIRDPRNVALSIKDHFQLTNKNAIDFLLNENNNLQIQNNQFFKGFMPILDWGSNYLSWVSDNRFDPLIIKYEDLIKDTNKIFLKILKYLQKYFSFDINAIKLSKVIDSTKFEILKKIENNEGFFEKKSMGIENNLNPFFNKGISRNYKKELDLNLISLIERKYARIMHSLGYL